MVSRRRGLSANGPCRAGGVLGRRLGGSVCTTINDNGGRNVTTQIISNGSCGPEEERSRSSPRVPRGAPQCLHLIWVVAGASSVPSKTIPSPSQISQTILNRGFASGGRCITLPQNKAAKAEYDRLTALLGSSELGGN